MPVAFRRRTADRRQLVLENRRDLLGQLEARPWELLIFDIALLGTRRRV
jgi:hypothetical protein